MEDRSKGEWKKESEWWMVIGCDGGRQYVRDKGKGWEKEMAEGKRRQERGEGKCLVLLSGKYCGWVMETGNRMCPIILFQAPKFFL